MSKEIDMQNWRVDSAASITAETMICQLAGMCNGAATWDGAGFSKFDVSFGHSLAEHVQAGRPWTAKQAQAALKMLRKYQRQLGGAVAVDQFMQNPTFRTQPIDPTAAGENAAAPTNDRVLSSRDKAAVFSFRYDPAVVTAIKNIRGEHRGKKYWASWDANARVWTVPVNETSIFQIMDVAEQFCFASEQRFNEYVARVREKTSENRVMVGLNGGRNVMLVDGSIVVAVPNLEIMDEFRRELECA